MTKMHNYYRKAKRFKLDGGNEVADEFSGGGRRHGQERWRQNSMWQRWGNKTRRFFRSRIGQNWDTVFSDFCKAVKLEGAYGEYWLREKWVWGVEQHVVMIDGYPHEKRGFRGSKRLSALSRGELYVAPDTKLLCVAEGLKKEPAKQPCTVLDWPYWREKPRHYGCKVVIVKQTEYVRKEQEYKRRIKPGVFKVEKVFVWYKYVPYTFCYTRRTGDALAGYVDEVISETRWHKYTASKKAIKKLGLNNEEV